MYIDLPFLNLFIDRAISIGVSSDAVMRAFLLVDIVVEINGLRLSYCYFAFRS